MPSTIKVPAFIDISYWQVVEWESLLPLPWLIAAKASEGFQSTVGAFQDARFQSHAKNIKRKGIRRMAYHFMRPGDIGNQAEYYISCIKQAGFDKDDLHVMDWEDYGNTLKEARQWLEHVERVIGQRPIIYSSAEVVQRLYDGQPMPAWFKDYWWWLAGYPEPDADRFNAIPSWYIPRGLTIENVAAWQYDEDGVYPGISGNSVDLNWLNPKWIQAINLKAPEGGTSMSYLYSITPTNTTGSKVRPEPDTGSAALPDSLPYNKYAYGNKKITIKQDKYEVINNVNIKVNQVGDVWLEVLEVNGAVLDTPAYIAEIHLGSRFARITQLSTPTDPPPTTEPKEDIVFTQTFSAAGYKSETVTVTLKPE